MNCRGTSHLGSPTCKIHQFCFRVFKQMLEEVTDSKFLNIQGLVASYEVGQNVPNAMETCPKYFPCKNDISETEDRKQCSLTAYLCPGYSIGCGLCAMFLPQTCGFVCPVAGLYCGK